MSNAQFRDVRYLLYHMRRSREGCFVQTRLTSLIAQLRAYQILPRNEFVLGRMVVLVHLLQYVVNRYDLIVVTRLLNMVCGRTLLLFSVHIILLILISLRFLSLSCAFLDTFKTWSFHHLCFGNETIEVLPNERITFWFDFPIFLVFVLLIIIYLLINLV